MPGSAYELFELEVGITSRFDLIYVFCCQVVQRRPEHFFVVEIPVTARSHRSRKVLITRKCPQAGAAAIVKIAFASNSSRVTDDIECYLGLRRVDRSRVQ